MSKVPTKDLFALFLAIFSITAHAIDDFKLTKSGIKYPGIALLVNDEDHTKIVMICHEHKPDHILCTFDQHSIKPGDNKDHLEMKSIMESQESKDKEIGNELLIDAKKSCKNGFDELKKLAEQFPTEENILLKETFDSFCKLPTRKNLIRFIDAHSKKESITCHTSNFAFRQEFKYNHFSNLWVYKNSPAINECGNYEVSTVKSEKDNPRRVDWTYKRTIKVLNDEASVLGLACKSFEEELNYYGPLDSKHAHTEINCKYIDFGFISDFLDYNVYTE